MSKLSYVAIVFFIILVNISSSYAKINETVLKQKRAVVTLYINDKDGKQIGTGTGFIIDSNGIIATNYHVISAWLEADNTLLVKMENGAYFPLQSLINYDNENDVALFKVDGKELPIINLSKDYLPKQGENIIVVGSPLGLETSVSDGIVSSVRGKDGVLQITAPVSPGSSGSPVFNSNGEVIAVVTFLISEGQNLNFAIPAKHVANLLKKALKPENKVVAAETHSEAPASKTVLPEPPDMDFEKADALFAGDKYDEAISEYISLWLKLVGINKNHSKIPYILLQIGKCFLEKGEDMPAWNYLKYLTKQYPNSSEATFAKYIISNKRWFLVGDTTDTLWFIDASSINSVDNNIVRALVKSQDRRGWASSVLNYLFDCVLGRMNPIGSIDYDSKGRIIKNTDFTEYFEWQTTSPNSIGEKLWNMVCGKE
jgi:hypothetical protein